MPRRGFTPRVDVYYVDKPPRAVVTVELAAVDPDDLALDITGRQLVIAGERKPTEAGGRLYQQIEIQHGPFRRVVELGADVQADKATASYADGILTVEIPLVTAADSARRVPISDS
jgi:HSP20 family protein